MERTIRYKIGDNESGAFGIRLFYFQGLASAFRRVLRRQLKLFSPKGKGRGKGGLDIIEKSSSITSLTSNCY